jgi:uncharacterized protein (DUF885 family)
MVNRREFLIQTVAGGALAIGGSGLWPAGSTIVAAATGEGVRARALYDTIFEAVLEAAPAMATVLGLDVGPRARLRHQLGDTSPAGRLSVYQPLIDGLPRLAQVDRTQLEGHEAAWLDTVRWLAERAGETADFRYGGVGGYHYRVPYVLTQLTGSYQTVPDFLDTRHPIESRDDAEAYLSRLSQFARNIEFESERARADARRGVVPPGFILEKALAQTGALRAESGETSALAASLARRTGERGLGNGWAKRAAAIVDGPLAAALDRQAATLEALRARSGGTAGASSLPEGARYYDLCLRFHTSTSLTPKEAHGVGLRQVAEIGAEADPLLRREGLTQGSVGTRLTALGREERYLYPNTEAGRADLLADLERQVDAVRARMPEVFQTLPRAPLEVRRVPPAIELGAPRGYWSAPSLDGSRPGTYYINLRDTRIWPTWALPTLTFHESLPGPASTSAPSMMPCSSAARGPWRCSPRSSIAGSTDAGRPDEPVGPGGDRAAPCAGRTRDLRPGERSARPSMTVIDRAIVAVP